MIAVPFWLLIVAAVLAWAFYLRLVFRSEPHRIVQDHDTGEWFCRDCGPGVLCPEAVKA